MALLWIRLGMARFWLKGHQIFTKRQLTGDTLEK